MLDPSQGPLMVDLTSLVRKPRMRTAWGGFLIEWRQVAFGSLGAVAVAPFVFAMFKLGLPTPALLFLSAGVGAGLFASAARPDGQTIRSYLWGAALGRAHNKVELPGEDGKARIYVGICPVADYHDGSRFVLESSAVRVNPDHLDERGAFRHGR